MLTVSFAVLGGVGIQILNRRARTLMVRMIGDTIFAVGAPVTGHSYKQTGYVAEGEWEVREVEPPCK